MDPELEPGVKPKVSQWQAPNMPNVTNFSAMHRDVTKVSVQHSVVISLWRYAGGHCHSLQGHRCELRSACETTEESPSLSDA